MDKNALLPSPLGLNSGVLGLNLPNFNGQQEQQHRFHEQHLNDFF
jgi:hypothetical protein